MSQNPIMHFCEDYGEVFPAELSADDFYRQLEFNLSRSQCYKPGEQVIYERSPADFLAYMLAIQLIDPSIAIFREATHYLMVVTANEPEFNQVTEIQTEN